MNQKMYELAIKAGIKDRSYHTHRQGFVASYLGEVAFEYEGKDFLAIGHDTDGCPMTVTREGYIEFIELNMENMVNLSYDRLRKWQDLPMIKANLSKILERKWRVPIVQNGYRSHFFLESFDQEKISFLLRSETGRTDHNINPPVIIRYGREFTYVNIDLFPNGYWEETSRKTLFEYN